MRKSIAAFALVAALLSTAACGSDTEPSQEETTSDWASEPDTTDTDESLDRAEISRIAMEITFDSSTPEEQAKVCLGIELYGREWSKQNLQAWVSPEARENTDWDASVDYLIERCAQR